MPAEAMKGNDSGMATGPAQGTPSFKNVCVYAASSEAPEYAGAARELGLAALEELQFRRKGLAVAVFFIVLVVIGLYFKIRQIENVPPPQAQ